MPLILLISWAIFHREFIKKLTFYSDKTFANHQKIADQLQVDTYFTQPYSFQDKVTVENRIVGNPSIFSEGIDLHKVSEERVKTVQQYLNFRPIRKFDYINTD